MAKTNRSARNTRSNLPRPGRTLTLFMIVVAGLFALVAGVGMSNDAGAEPTWQPRLGLDLQGGTRITLQASATSGGVTPDKLSQARDIIDQRVNASGVSEAEVTTQGGDQVIIEIPGQKKGDIVDEVGRTAQLRFRLVWADQLPSATEEPDQAAIDEAQKTIDDLDWTKLSVTQMIQAETEGVQTLDETYQEGIAALQ